MAPTQDPAEAEFNEAWQTAEAKGIKSEFHAALEAERRLLNEEAADGDRTFEAPMTRNDCIHGLYFRGAFDRALDAARKATK